MLGYPVLLERDTNDTFLVTFPGFPEAHTFGEDEKDALARAADLLLDVLADYMDDRKEIPAPRPIAKKGRSLEVPVLAAAKIELYRAMRANKIGKSGLARSLGWNVRQIDRLLDLHHPSQLDQLEAAFRALGKRLRIQVQDAA
jgi:antitoxin HicB